MANVKVEITVKTSSAKEVYIVGNVKELGEWDPKKAIKLEKLDNGLFQASKMLPAGGMVEYKVLSGKSWDNVEKGAYDEEIENHMLTPTKGLKELVEVIRFAN